VERDGQGINAWCVGQVFPCGMHTTEARHTPITLQPAIDDALQGIAFLA
jgi:hypothetical protein